MPTPFELIIEAARLLHEKKQWAEAGKILETAFDLTDSDKLRDAICANARTCFFLANDVPRAFHWLEQQQSIGIVQGWEIIRDKSNYLRYLNRHDEAHSTAQQITDARTRNLAVSWFEHRQGLTRQAFESTELSRDDSYWWRQSPPKPYRIWHGDWTENLVIWAESGAGDQIIFSRWIPALKKMCRNLYYRGHDSLEKVMLRNFEIPSADEAPGNHEIVPIMSLAHRLGIDAPDRMRYLRADPDVVQRYLTQYPCTKAARIGLCCQGEPTHVETTLRSLPQDQLIDCLQDLGEIVNLQKITNGVDTRMDYIPFETWEDTLALITTCDAVVTCDTGVAHAAAALGKPTIVLMHAAAYFTWNHNQDLGASDWYEDAWCVHQDLPCDWTGSISKTSTLLRQLLRRTQ